MLTASIGKEFLMKICKEKPCILPSVKYLNFKGVLKALSTECPEIYVENLRNPYIVNVNGIKISIIPMGKKKSKKNKELYYYTSINELYFNEILYNAEIENYMKSVTNVLRKISKKYSLTIEGKTPISFIPWNHKKYIVSLNEIKVLHLPPLGLHAENIISRVKMKPIKSRYFETNVFSLKADKHKLCLNYKGYEYFLKFKNPIEKILGNYEKKYLLLLLSNGEEYVFITPSMEIHTNCKTFYVETDFEGGLLTWFTLFTVNNEKINYDEEVNIQGPLWYDYSTSDHGLGVHISDRAYTRIKGNFIEISQSKGAVMKLHKGSWEEGGIDYLSIEELVRIKYVRFKVRKNVTLLELMPKHVIPLNIRLRGNVLTLELFNFSTKPLLSRIRIPWKIEEAFKVSVFKGKILDDVSYDYNVILLPMTANEYARLKVKISPMIILR